MFNRLLKEASLYSLSSLLARGFSIITVPIFTRVLSPADYGALDLLSYVAVLLPLLVGAALDQAIARFYLDTEETEAGRKQIASTVLIYTIVAFAIVGMAVSPAAGWLSARWLDGQVGPGTIQVVIVYIWVQSVFYIANNQLRYLFRVREYALCNVGNTILSTGLGLVFVVWLRLGVAGVFAGQAIGQAVFALLSLYLARESYGLTFSRPALQRMLAYSLPLVPGTLSFYAMQYVDRYALNELKGLADVGIYGMGARIASLVNLFLMGFQNAWWPRVMNSFREPGAAQNFRTVFYAYLLVTAAILMTLSLFGREILLLLTNSTFAEGYRVVPMLVLSAVLSSIAAYFTFGIQIEQRSHYRMLLNLGALAVNVVLNLALIPRFGAMGAATADAISFLLLVVAAMTVSQRLYRVPYSWAGVILSGVLAVLVSNAMIFWRPEFGFVTVLMKLTMVGFACVIIAWILRLPLNPAAWRRVAGL